ncbi:alkylhydroperoxidase/carboxymuconolactone decarboxylase family protein YurZ [Streptacidiphilus sp. EB103A]
MWEHPQFSPRDRSLVTVGVLAALYRTEPLNFPRPRPSTT